MLQDMFRTVLPYTSLTFENGSASWIGGKIYQHVNSFKKMENLFFKLRDVRSKKIKGFEPKEFIITIHCKNRVKKIENIVVKYRNLYCIWNDEAYDIGLRKKQTKAAGLVAFLKILGLKRSNVLFLGDNYNDIEMLEEAGISVSADPHRVKGDYSIPLGKKELPGFVLMGQIIGALGKK